VEKNHENNCDKTPFVKIGRTFHFFQLRWIKITFLVHKIGNANLTLNLLFWVLGHGSGIVADETWDFREKKLGFYPWKKRR